MLLEGRRFVIPLHRSDDVGVCLAFELPDPGGEQRKRQAEIPAKTPASRKRLDDLDVLGWPTPLFDLSR